MIALFTQVGGFRVPFVSCLRIGGIRAPDKSGAFMCIVACTMRCQKGTLTAIEPIIFTRSRRSLYPRPSSNLFKWGFDQSFTLSYFQCGASYIRRTILDCLCLKDWHSDFLMHLGILATWALDDPELTLVTQTPVQVQTGVRCVGQCWSNDRCGPRLNTS
jgi:hypothetical protein